MCRPPTLVTITEALPHCLPGQALELERQDLQDPVEPGVPKKGLARPGAAISMASALQRMTPPPHSFWSLEGRSPMRWASCSPQQCSACRCCPRPAFVELIQP